jgi:hypothetical protein
MNNIAILGSCVTRDAFNFDNKSFDIKAYFARTSIISLTSTSLDIDESKITLSSPFQIKCIIHDLKKDFFKIIENKAINYVIIDLIDERFNLLKINESIITKSNELQSSNLLNHLDFKEIKRDENLDYLWKESAKAFFNRLTEIIPPSNIIIHKALWKSKYYDQNGKIEEFTKQLGEINQQNSILCSYYQYIEEHFTDFNIIDMTQENLLCTVNHRWGLSPYHYEEKYYNVFLDKLNKSFPRKTNEENLSEIMSELDRKSVIISDDKNIVFKVDDTKLVESYRDIEFAYYVKLNDEIIYREWYGKYRNFIYTMEFEGNYEVVIFIRNQNNKDKIKYFTKKLSSKLGVCDLFI